MWARPVYEVNVVRASPTFADKSENQQRCIA